MEDTHTLKTSLCSTAYARANAGSRPGPTGLNYYVCALRQQTVKNTSRKTVQALKSLPASTRQLRLLTNCFTMSSLQLCQSDASGNNWHFKAQGLCIRRVAVSSHSHDLNVTGWCVVGAGCSEHLLGNIACEFPRIDLCRMCCPNCARPSL